MKKIIPYLFLCNFLLLPSFGKAQVKIGTRIGISTYNLNPETIEAQSLSIAIRQANYGFHFGFFLRGHFSKRFYLQPEILFNSNSVDYEANDLTLGLIKSVFGENYQYLDLPILFGYKLGPFHIEGGPVGHAYLASKTELELLNIYENRLNNFHLGYQAGIGLDIFRLVLDVRFEGSFNKFGDQIYLEGTSTPFSQNANRWVVTIGYAF